MLRTPTLFCLLLTVALGPVNGRAEIGPRNSTGNSAVQTDVSTDVPAKIQAIPRLTGTTFSGAAVYLPADLKGHAGVLVLGFSQGSRDAVTVWGKRLATDYYTSPTVLYYELPILASVPKLLRGFVEGRIRATVSDRGKAHFLPIVDDEIMWRAVAQYDTAKPDAPYVLLVDSLGRVRWRTSSMATDSVYNELRHQLANLKTQ